MTYGSDQMDEWLEHGYAPNTPEAELADAQVRITELEDALNGADAGVRALRARIAELENGGLGPYYRKRIAELEAALLQAERDALDESEGLVTRIAELEAERDRMMKEWKP